jgi:uncharacterized protein
MNKPGTKMSRRRFLGGVSLFTAAGFGYAHFIEARWLHVNHVRVPLWNGARAPLKLLHLSDLHASPMVSLDFIAEAVEAALKFAPDLICLTGDFVTGTFDEPVRYAQILRRLSEAAPCFAVPGNHDGGYWASEHGGYRDLTWMKSLLIESGVPLLENANTKFHGRDSELNIVGTADLWSQHFDPVQAFNGTVANAPTVVLTHNPDAKTKLAQHPWSLMLSGHTHGGQLRVPLVGAPFAPVIDKRFVSGLHHWNERWLHITRGVGNVWGVRINCPPEISCLTVV